MKWLAFPLSIVFLLIALFGIFAACILIYGLYRKIIQKEIMHDSLGKVVTVGSEGGCEIEIDGRKQKVCFPVKGGVIANEIAGVIADIPRHIAAIRQRVAGPAVSEYREIREAYTEPEDKAVIEKMDTLMDRPPAFIGEFVLEQIEVEDDPETVTFVYLTPWDPEHTRSAVFDFRFNLLEYGMSCAM